jgi:two-component system chemotaxis response regulator CheY
MATILLVDDSKLSRSLSAAAMEDIGHTVIEAADGQEAIGLFERHHPDCIVSDLLMPIMDGYAFVEQIREIDPLVPIVVLTADIQKTSRSMCARLGVSGFVNKPVQAEVLQARVREAIAANREGTKCN